LIRSLGPGRDQSSKFLVINELVFIFIFKLANTIAAYRLANVTYHGQKTHEKKVLAYLDRAQKAEFTQQQLGDVCRALLNLEAFKLLRSYTALGRRRFPDDPHFCFFEAEGYIALGPYRCPMWKVQPLLDKARELAARLPPDDAQKALLEAIEHRQRMIGGANPLGGPQAMGMLEEMFQMLGDEAGEFEDEDEDEFVYDEEF